MKVLMLAGGDSSEREVSLASGEAVFAALNRLGHEVLAIDPANGQSLIDDGGKFLVAANTASVSSEPTVPSTTLLKNSLDQKKHSDADVLFIVLHGGAGENGTIQGLLDIAHMRYTGSGMTASAVAMNKGMSKKLFSSVGISTPDWEVYERSERADFAQTTAGDITRRFDLPVIVKPNDGGSTVALTKVTAEDQLIPAIELAAGESDTMLVESYIDGKELTVAVLSGHAFPVVEIRPKSGLYDYEAKYTEGKTEYIAPAKISGGLAEKVKKAAVDAYTVIGANGLARIDFIAKTNEEFYILELNSLPGMTELSLAPMAAKCEGVNFDQLVQRIIDDALKRSG